MLKVSQQVNLNHSDLSKYSNAQYVFAVFCFTIAHDYDPTVVRTIISSSSDIFWQFNRRYSRICSSIVPQNSPQNFVCIVPYIVTTEFVHVAYTTCDTWSKSLVLRSHPTPSINDSTGIFASISKVDKFNPILCKASRSQKSKMAAHKHGKLICQLVYNVAGQFQMLRTCIFGLKNSAERFPILCNASERTYISACIKYSCAIPTTIPMFSRSRNAKKLFFIMCDAC